MLVRAGLLERKYERDFTRIFESGYWGGRESVSGGGSSLVETAEVRAALPGIIHTNRITSILDVPCGDFHWMRETDLADATYTGGDIVRTIIESNLRRYAGPGRTFIHTDLIHDRLPKADLILCRDCLVHLPLPDCLKALENFAESGARFVLTTTFVSHEVNSDIAAGKWRPLNLRKPPFNLPEPVLIVDEKCAEADGRFRDKALGLWHAGDILTRIRKDESGLLSVKR